MTFYLTVFTIGLALITIGAWKSIESNPHRRIPLLRPATVSPPSAILVQLLGYASVISSALMLSDSWGLYSYLLFAVMALPDLILYTTHNQQLKHRGLPQG